MARSLGWWWPVIRRAESRCATSRSAGTPSEAGGWKSRDPRLARAPWRATTKGGYDQPTPARDLGYLARPGSPVCLLDQLHFTASLVDVRQQRLDEP